MTVREAIALAAAGAMTEVDGVAGPAFGPDGRYGTPLGAGRIPGVVTAAAAGGGYDVTLYVVARPVPLMPLGQRLAARVTGAVGEAGFADELAEVRVVVIDVEEPAAPAAGGVEAAGPAAAGPAPAPEGRGRAAGAQAPEPGPAGGGEGAS